MEKVKPVLLPILGILSPIISRQVAQWLSDYFNERREARLLKDEKMAYARAMDSEILKEICQARLPKEELVEEVIVTKSRPAPLLASGMLGAALGAVACFFYVKRSDL